MSFHVEYLGRSKEHALAVLEKQNLPGSIKEFVKVGIQNTPDRDTLIAISIKAQGHLCDGAGSYEVTNCSISVTPLYAAAEIKAEVSVEAPAAPIADAGQAVS